MHAQFFHWHFHMLNRANFCVPPNDDTHIRAARALLFNTAIPHAHDVAAGDDSTPHLMNQIGFPFGMSRTNKIDGPCCASPFVPNNIICSDVQVHFIHPFCDNHKGSNLISFYPPSPFRNWISMEALGARGSIRTMMRSYLKCIYNLSKTDHTELVIGVPIFMLIYIDIYMYDTVIGKAR